MKSYTLNIPPNYVKPKLPRGKKWVRELREGNYPQTIGSLAHEQLDGQLAYCCLGVLSKLQGRLCEAGGVFRDKSSAHILQEDNECAQSIGRDGRFPFDVEVYDEDGNICPSLSYCNDYGLTFPQIADIIEAVWECE